MKTVAGADGDIFLIFTNEIVFKKWHFVARIYDMRDELHEVNF